MGAIAPMPDRGMRECCLYTSCTMGRGAGIGSGDRRRRASSARGPSTTSFGLLAFWAYFGPDKGWPIDFGQATRAAGAARYLVEARGRFCGARLECAPHPPPCTPPSIAHACARVYRYRAVRFSASDMILW